MSIAITLQWWESYTTWATQISTYQPGARTSKRAGRAFPGLPFWSCRPLMFARRRRGHRRALFQPKHSAMTDLTESGSPTGVRFPDSFDTAPVILATASNLNAYVHKTAAVNMVRGITKDGFVMAARNSDCQGGSCGFAYLALSFCGCCRVQTIPGHRLGISEEVREGL
jgi:hypothetical protein